MFSQTDTIHFSCTQCGKCCVKSPNMHFYDMIELSEEFIFQTAHHVVISSSKKPLEKVLLDHYQALGHTIVLPEMEASLFYFIDFTTMSYPSYKMCSKLIDNKCSIYNIRPSTCRLAPLDYKFDDTQQWRTLQYFKNNVEKNDWKCSFDKKEPVLFSNEQIYNIGQNSLYFQSVDFIRNITDKYIEFLGVYDKKYQTEHFKRVFNSCMKNQMMISDMILPLQVAIYHNIISEEYAVKFIENQIKLIDKEFQAAKDNKRKEDLQYSRLYKKQKEDYVKALNNDIFNEAHNSFSII